MKRNTLSSPDIFYQVAKGLRIELIYIRVNWAIRSGINADRPGGTYRKSFWYNFPIFLASAISARTN